MKSSTMSLSVYTFVYRVLSSTCWRCLRLFVMYCKIATPITSPPKAHPMPTYMFFELESMLSASVLVTTVPEPERETSDTVPHVLVYCKLVQPNLEKHASPPSYCTQFSIWGQSNFEKHAFPPQFARQVCSPRQSHPDVVETVLQPALR